MFRSTFITATFLTILTSSSSAAAFENPQLFQLPSATVVAPFIPGGGVVTAYVKPEGRRWIEVEFHGEAGSELVDLVPQHGAFDMDADYQVWNFPCHVTAREVCLFAPASAGLPGLPDAPCWMEAPATGAVIDPAVVIPFALDEGETVLATSLAAWSTDDMVLLSVVEGPTGTVVRAQAVDGAGVTTEVVDVTSLKLGAEQVAVRAWVSGNDSDIDVIVLAESGAVAYSEPVVSLSDHALNLVPVDASLADLDPDTLRTRDTTDGAAEFVNVSVQDGAGVYYLDIDPVNGFVEPHYRGNDPDDDEDPQAATYSFTVELENGEKITVKVRRKPREEQEKDQDQEEKKDEEKDEEQEEEEEEEDQQQDQVYLELYADGELRWRWELGDTDEELTADSTLDTLVALGGDAFLAGDPDRPVILGSGLLTVAATGTAALDTGADVNGPAAFLTLGETAAVRVDALGADTALELDAMGERALAVLAGEPGTMDIVDWVDGYWQDPKLQAGPADLIASIEEALDLATLDDLDAAAVVEHSAGDALQNLKTGETWVSAESVPVLGWTDYNTHDPGITILQYNHAGGGDGVGTYAALQTSAAGGDERYGSAVALMCDSGWLAADSYEVQVSVMTNDPATPLYETARKAIWPMCGGWGYLSAVETTSIRTTSSATAIYSVTLDVSDEPDQSPQTVVQWTDLQTAGKGTLDIQLTATDGATGTVMSIIDTSCSMDSGWSSLVDVPQIADIVGDVTILDLTYTVTSDGGGEVSLDNAVVFGWAGDTDGDGLGDLEEYAEIGTDPLVADTDGDGVDDGDDPLPLEPGVGCEWLSSAAILLGDSLAVLDLELFDAPNDNSAENWRNNLVSTADRASTRFASGQISSAIAQLDTLADAVDPDTGRGWLVVSDEAYDLTDQVWQLLDLAALE